MVVVFWIIFAFVVAMMGDSRKIGFGWALFWACLLSPLIGVLIVLASDRKKPQEVVVKGGVNSVADELAKLADLRDRKIISEEDFEKQKAKVLAK
jgi:hypothetical protein